jgi:hypothetical protein
MAVDQDGTSPQPVILMVQIRVLEDRLQVVAPHLAEAKVVAQTAALRLVALLQVAQLREAQLQAALHPVDQHLMDRLAVALLPEVREVDQAASLAAAAQAASISLTRTSNGGDSDA